MATLSQREIVQKNEKQTTLSHGRLCKRAKNRPP